MEDPTITTRLNELERGPRAAVTRFDPGPPFAGRVAVLPSAFNPPTVAHMELLEVARLITGVESVAAMLTTKNVDKGLHGASPGHRIGMLLAVSEDGARCAVLAANVARIVDQGRALRETYPGTDFDFVVGYDTLVRLFDGRYYADMSADLDAFFARHRVIAANRGGATVAAVEAFLDQNLEASRRRGRVIVCELHKYPASLSSTAAREAAARGELHPAVAGAVAEYIARHRLYRER